MVCVFAIKNHKSHFAPDRALVARANGHFLCVDSLSTTTLNLNAIFPSFFVAVCFVAAPLVCFLSIIMIRWLETTSRFNLR